jgi:hypothetical protein
MPFKLNIECIYLVDDSRFRVNMLIGHLVVVNSGLQVLI